MRRPRRARVTSVAGLAAALFVGVGCGGTPPALQPGRTPPPTPVPGALGSLERDVFRAVNEWRRSSGLPAYAWSGDVAALARGHSEDMASERARFGHDGMRQRLAFLQRSLPVASVAENVSRHAGRSPAEVTRSALDGWLASPSHRRNLSGPHDLTGIGAARGSDGTYYLTQLFVKRR